MSSWIADLDRSMIRPTGPQGKYRTNCKVGLEAIMVDTPARWVTDSRLAPLGLSCLEHLADRATELGLVVPEETPVAKAPATKGPKVIRQRKPWPEPVHGKVSTYGNHGCKCDPCRAANTARSAARRAKARQQAGALA